MHSGWFVSLEGPDGCGKSTVMPLLKAWLNQRGYTVVTTFEPGATAVGQQLRRLLLQGEAAMEPLTEALLMAADRAQHVAEVIRPALERGEIVITDRYVDSSLVYQGYAGGVPVDTVRRINEEATGGLYPDVTILLDVPLDVARARRERQASGKRGTPGHAERPDEERALRRNEGTDPDGSSPRPEARDRFEGRGADFQRRVHAGFHDLARITPERIVVVPNVDSPDQVTARIGELIVSRMTGKAGG